MRGKGGEEGDERIEGVAAEGKGWIRERGVMVIRGCKTETASVGRE